MGEWGIEMNLRVTCVTGDLVEIFNFNEVW